MPNLSPLNDSSLIAARQDRFAALQLLFDGAPAKQAFRVWGTGSWGHCDMYRQPEQWIHEALGQLCLKTTDILDPAVFRPLCVEPGFFGVHFVDRVLGADVFELDGAWQVHELTSPLGQLRSPDLDTSPTWQLARRAAQAFLDAKVRLPLFGLPTIASTLNVGVNLYGGNLLEAFYTRPEEAARDLATINQTLIQMHRWYLEHLPIEQLQPVVSFQRTQPPGFGQICGCTTQLLSPALYRDFVAPLDNALLATYPRGGMIHLCGTHAQHLPVWRQMKSLRAFQLNDRAAADLPLYFQQTREDQILYVMPCPEMPREKILEITGGKRLVLMAGP